MVAAIGLFLILESVNVLESTGPAALFLDHDWQPTAGHFGLLPMIVGSLLVTVGALAVVGPLGLLVALFLRFYAPQRCRGACRRGLEVCAGIPSVVYGLWGLVEVVPLVRRVEPPGASLLAAALVLGLMVLPTFVLLADRAFGAVPREVTVAVAALGLSRFRAITGVHLEAARPGLLAATLLATGRALGETMAVLMVAGNVVQFPHSVFDPLRTLTANIGLEMAYALDVHRSSLFASGLLLMIVATMAALVARRETAK